ncbi:MAG TPA: glycosyltransferase [Thermodesulfobacteriota bacterium]|nr:glycosyltransferase [Thermodesulfobacteriota bacterium]
MTGLTLIIPVYNEEPILRENILRIYDYLEGIDDLDSFEIMLACNGCTDASEEISEALSNEKPGIRHLSIEGRGLGAAIREAARIASYDMMMFYAVDIPFGLTVIGDSIAAARENKKTVVIGSKGHRDSRVRRGVMRVLFSATISILNNRLFGLGVSDTQGSILFYGETLRRYRDLMDSAGPFFQTQILIYSKLSGYRLMEIPVELTRELRGTRFSLASDGLGYISSLFREKAKLRRQGII